MLLVKLSSAVVSLLIVCYVFHLFHYYLMKITLFLRLTNTKISFWRERYLTYFVFLGAFFFNEKRIFLSLSKCIRYSLFI